MIGSIDHQADIELYLEADEIERLPTGTIEGVLVKSKRPKNQGSISISINDARKNENGCGVGLDDSKYWGVEDFRVDVFMSTIEYQELRENGIIGLRQRMRDGSKIHIYDRSKLEFMDSIRAENLEFYRDNKERF